MTNLNVQFIATDDKVNLEKLEREFGRHAAFREALRDNDSIELYDADENYLYRAEKADNLITVIFQAKTDEAPTSPSSIILDGGFCHHGDVMKRTFTLPVPDAFYDDNYRESRMSAHCGCSNCGSIFSGNEVTEMSSSPGGRDGMAFCPICGSNTVIAEECGVTINDDNLWRWHQHTFGTMPMYRDLPKDMSKVSLADMMRHMR